MKFKKICFVMLFMFSYNMLAQSDFRLNILISINNSLRYTGEIEFVFTENDVADTIYAEYYLGSVIVSDSDYVKLSTVEVREIIYTYLGHNTKDDKLGFVRLHYFGSLDVVTKYDVLVFTFYEKWKKKKKVQYGFGCVGVVNEESLYHTTEPMDKKIRKKYEMFTGMIHNFW